MIKGLNLHSLFSELFLSAVLVFFASPVAFANSPVTSYKRARQLMAVASQPGVNDAARWYGEALDILTQIKEEHPTWNALIVEERIKKCHSRIDAISYGEKERIKPDELLAYARKIEADEVEMRKRAKCSGFSGGGEAGELFYPSPITFKRVRSSRKRAYASAAVEHFERARQMMRQKDYNGAIEELREVIYIDGNYVEAFIAMGEIYETVGKDAIAMEAYRSAISIDNDTAEAHCGIGNLLVREGMMLEQESKLMEAWAKYQNAILEYKRATWFDIDCGPAYYGIGVAYSRLGRHSDAAYYWKKTIRITGEDSEIGKRAASNLGVTGLAL